jgi:hypothetical protein
VLIGLARQAEINLNVRPQLDVDRQTQHCGQALIADPAACNPPQSLIP